MRVLLVESTPGNASAVRDWLTEAGHESAVCFEPPVGLACRGVDHHSDCPLEQPTDVALLVRDLDGGAHSLTEMGAVCALRHRVPVVEVAETNLAHDLEGTLLNALASSQDAGETNPYEQAVHAALATVTSLPDPSAVGVSVQRSTDRVHAMLTVPAGLDDRYVPMVVDRASRALREHDPYVKVIDVGIARR